LSQNPPNRPAAILKQANPQSYAQARALLDHLRPVSAVTVAEKIDRVCFHWWSGTYVDAPDERKVRDLLRMAVTNALNDVRVEQAKLEATERYEHCRANWIAKHGSQRLKRAAARGYRHDGIYRDERLTLELPDFVGSLGRKPTVRELVNPSEHALELESQTLARAEALGIPEDKVRLVFAQPGQDSDWADGEFVQIDGYLDRHTVWQSVSGERSDDDIPFWEPDRDARYPPGLDSRAAHRVVPAPRRGDRARGRDSGRSPVRQGARVKQPHRAVLTDHAAERAERYGVPSSQVADVVLGEHERRLSNPGAPTGLCAVAAWRSSTTGPTKAMNRRPAS
jgi:hypothetical protein